MIGPSLVANYWVRVLYYTEIIVPLFGILSLQIVKA